jgi:hypothetical protein
MEFNENAEINPFAPSIPKYYLTKSRAHQKDNYFQIGRNDYSERIFNTKARQIYIPKLEFNPFKGCGRVPFRKEEDRVPPVHQGLKNERRISNNKRSSDEDDELNINLRPNINIYIISDCFIQNKSPFQNRDNILGDDSPAPAIAPNDPVDDLNTKLSKMKLKNKLVNPFKIKLNIKKKNNERIYDNNMEDQLGDYYID